MSPLGRVGAVGVVAAVLLAGCAQPTPQPSVTTVVPTTDSTTAQTVTSPATPQVASCTQMASSMTIAQQVGQLAMVGVPSQSTTIPSDVAAAVKSRNVGAVILVGDTTMGVDGVARLTTQITRTNPEASIIIAADQEGGLVQRLQGPGFDTIAAAATQATWTDAQLRAKAVVWGSQLQQAGVTFNLAPVADVVPEKMRRSNQPIGALQRGFGSDPQVVASKVTAVVLGYSGAGVATSIKHFPNLGAVTGNTDTTVKVVDTVTNADSASMASFAAGIDAGTSSVMISNAVYEKIDPSNPAVFSSNVISILRDKLDFDGVVISDDLGAAKAVSGTPSAQRGVKFLAAGGDLFLTVDADQAIAMIDAVVAKAASDPTFAASITTKAARVLTMKSAHGLVECN